MTQAMSGLELSRRFFHEAAKPILDAQFPATTYSAALIGWGSEVLGYDDIQSTDHHWGPRFLLLLSPEDYQTLRAPISEALSTALPYTFYGYSTNFSPPDAQQVRMPQPIDSGPVQHLIHIDGLERFFEWYLGLNPLNVWRPVDWLSLSEQKLLSITSGAVFYDPQGDLTQIRQRLAYYPRDVWLYLLACQWQKVAEEEAFAGRCSAVGDELGSMLIAARLAHSLIKLCFLMEQTYAPYSKWLGTAFQRLPCASDLQPVLMQLLRATSYQEREAGLVQAYALVAGLHNALGVTEPLDTQATPYHARPYLVIHAERFAEAIWDRIEDPTIKELSFKGGSINQVVESDDQISNVWLGQQLRILYEE